MQFIGVTAKAIFEARKTMDEVCYQKARCPVSLLLQTLQWPCWQQMRARPVQDIVALRAAACSRRVPAPGHSAACRALTRPWAQVVEALEAGHQAMVFVHSRKDAGATGRTLVTKAQNAGQLGLFDCSQEDAYAYMQRDVRKSRNKCAPCARAWGLCCTHGLQHPSQGDPCLRQQSCSALARPARAPACRELQELFPSGIGMHHAGMLRPDRSLMERAFGQGLLKVPLLALLAGLVLSLPGRPAPHQQVRLRAGRAVTTRARTRGDPRPPQLPGSAEHSHQRVCLARADTGTQQQPAHTCLLQLS